MWCRRWSQLCALVQQRSTPSAVGTGVICERLDAGSVIPRSPGQLCPAVCTQMWVSWNVKWCFHSQLDLESSCCRDHEVGPVVKLLWVLVAKSEMLILPRLKRGLFHITQHILGTALGENGSAQASLRTAAHRVDSFCPQEPRREKKEPSVK